MDVDGDDRVRAWFAGHTYRWCGWELDELLALKRSGPCGSQRVSVVVPARNEAPTVGGIVERLRRELVEDVPLIDELVVIDSDSTDDTARLAEKAGASVFAANRIRPDLGTFPGKGEAMWKSLFVTTGDVVAFIDADLISWGPHFVSGLLGPLLAEPSLHLVKGFYDRLLDPGDLSHDPGSTYEGGRVTELVARPLLSLRWPELSGVVQPLAGEWAARRDLLSSLHIPTGYGVELAVLVDTYRRRGLDAIAQVDLGRRAHTHQPLRDLGAMAVELMAVADSRAEGGPALTRDVLLRQFGVEDERGHVVRRELALAERPPAASVAPATAFDPHDPWQAAANGTARVQAPAPQPCAGR